MSKYRLLSNPEKQQKAVLSTGSFYLISVDVGRLSCQTVACIFKVQPRESGYFISLVNIVVLGKTPESKHFEKQVIDLKRLILAFNPKEVVIDGNGLGIGFLDYMIKEQIDNDGTVLPAIGCFNDDSYKKIQAKDIPQLIYVIKANGALNSKIHSNCFTQITSGHVKFLIKESEAKNKLMASKKGARLPIDQRIERLMPHEMTTRLFEEMANLKLRQNGLEIQLEQINTRSTKDKFSAFEYGLWRIKEIEEENAKKTRRKGKKRSYTFFTQGG